LISPTQRGSPKRIIFLSFFLSFFLPLLTQEWILDIATYDHDRYANHTELCSLKVSLKDARKIFYSPEIHLFNYRMKPSNQVSNHNVYL